MHRFECPANVPSEGWQPPPACCTKAMALLGQSRKQLLATRGLLATKVRVPMQRPAEHFKWIIAPDPDRDTSGDVWFVDGSLFDEAHRFARRTGYSMVIVAHNGDLVACGNGTPPHWIVDAAGAELWTV